MEKERRTKTKLPICYCRNPVFVNIIWNIGHRITKNDTEDDTEGEDKNDQLEVQYKYHWIKGNRLRPIRV